MEFVFATKEEKKKTVSLGNSKQLVIKERWASGCYAQQLEDGLQKSIEKASYAY